MRYFPASGAASPPPPSAVRRLSPARSRRHGPFSAPAGAGIELSTAPRTDSTPLRDFCVTERSRTTSLMPHPGVAASQGGEAIRFVHSWGKPCGRPHPCLRSSSGPIRTIRPRSGHTGMSTDVLWICGQLEWTAGRRPRERPGALVTTGGRRCAQLGTKCGERARGRARAKDKVCGRRGPSTARAPVDARCPPAVHFATRPLSRAGIGFSTASTSATTNPELFEPGRCHPPTVCRSSFPGPRLMG